MHDFDGEGWSTGMPIGGKGGYGGSTSAYGGTAAYKPCDHYGDVEFATITHDDGRVTALTGISQWGWGKIKRVAAENFALIIDCGAITVPTPLLPSELKRPDFVAPRTDAGKALVGLDPQALNRHVVWEPPVPLQAPPILALAWSDGAAPIVAAEFWVELASALPAGTVAACCVGGHGRTGTTLAALLIASGMTFYEATVTIWTSYCAKAIETDAQIGYLKALDRALHGDKADTREITSGGKTK